MYILCRLVRTEPLAITFGKINSTICTFLKNQHQSKEKDKLSDALHHEGLLTILKNSKKVIIDGYVVCFCY